MNAPPSPSLPSCRLRLHVLAATDIVVCACPRVLCCLPALPPTEPVPSPAASSGPTGTDVSPPPQPSRGPSALPSRGSSAPPTALPTAQQSRSEAPSRSNPPSRSSAPSRGEAPHWPRCTCVSLCWCASGVCAWGIHGCVLAHVVGPSDLVIVCAIHCPRVFLAALHVPLRLRPWCGTQ